MKKNEPVSKIMSADPVSVTTNESVSGARKLMEQKGIHHLPVTEADRVVGIISSSDFLRVSFGEFGNQDERGLDAMLDHTYKLADLMNPNPVTVSNGDSIRDAARILATSDFHSLPVVDGTKLVGIITSSDLIQYLLDQY
jgi:CBS domain-containing protein